MSIGDIELLTLNEAARRLDRTGNRKLLTRLALAHSLVRRVGKSWVMDGDGLAALEDLLAAHDRARAMDIDGLA